MRLRGSALAAGREGVDIPAVPMGEPEAPEWLTPDARLLWNDAVVRFRGTGRLSPLDQHSLGRYVQTLAEWWRLSAEPDPSPAVMRRAHQLAQQLGTLEDRFGFNPAARARLGFGTEPPPQADDGAARFFGPVPLDDRPHEG
ncbi:MAG: P27 family phage terminase small subunit [Planctomycetes bacterium]|nr:P27 family phage terminase small subunit [Planctomycetota bacterium]